MKNNIIKKLILEPFHECLIHGAFTNRIRCPHCNQLSSDIILGLDLAGVCLDDFWNFINKNSQAGIIKEETYKEWRKNII